VLYTVHFWCSRSKGFSANKLNADGLTLPIVYVISGRCDGSIIFLFIIISVPMWAPLVRFSYEFLRHMVELPGRVIISSQGFYLHRTTQHSKTKDKHPCQFLIIPFRPSEPSGREAGERRVRKSAGKFCRQCNSITLRGVLLHAVKLRHWTNSFTSTPKEVRATDFYYPQKSVVLGRV
jgi:hypothetical protein